jgi:hypothetical protein
VGAWGTGLFQDDTACDVRDEFVDLVSAGQSTDDATGELERKWGTPHFDPDDEPVFWVALAATQYRYGRLVSRVRDRAIEVIDSGRDIERFLDAKSRSKRQAVLEKLKAEMLGPQRKPRRVAPRKLHQNDWPVGAILTYRLISGHIVLFRVTHHHIDKGGRYAWVEVLKGTSDSLPSEWLIAATPARLDRDRRYFELFILPEYESSDRLALVNRGKSIVAAIFRRFRKPPRLAGQRTGVISSPGGLDEILSTYLDLS